MAHAGEGTLIAPDVPDNASSTTAPEGQASCLPQSGRQDACPTAVADLVRRLIERLADAGVRYCHWKSNFSLPEALAGAGDLDLLVGRGDAPKFEAVLAELGFKRAVDPFRPHMPSVIHYYGLDEATGRLIHLHVYHRVLTGETFLKNYAFPLEELLLESPRLVEGMPAARPEVELIVFVVRAMMKYASLAEHLMIAGQAEGVRAELRALLADGAAAKARALLPRWLPGVDPGLFDRCVDALLHGGAFRRFWLGRKLRAQLRPLGRFPRWLEPVLRVRVFLLEVLRLLFLGRGSPKDLAAGGAVVAFVGLDASGKSTLVRAGKDWLGGDFRVYRGHIGKPRSSWLTLVPNLIGRLLRRVLPGVRMSGRQEKPEEKRRRRPGLLYSLRMVLLAWDRRAMALRLRRKAANGAIVLCDRYPSPVPGVIDSPQLMPPEETGSRGLRAYLARLEGRLYRQIPPPDIVIRVIAPTAVAVERNRERYEPGKDKSDSYLLFNHENVTLPSFPNAPVVEFSTDRSKEETVRALRRLLWRLL